VKAARKWDIARRLSYLGVVIVYGTSAYRQHHDFKFLFVVAPMVVGLYLYARWKMRRDAARAEAAGTTPPLRH
jgi:hypothetical protein